MDVESLLVSAPWLCVAIWCFVYAADYYLTIAAARLYAHGASDHIAFEDGIELNPQMAADVNALRMFSPRFVRFLVLNSILIVAFWYLAVLVPDTRNLFLFFFGAILFPELAVEVRHAGNLAQLRRLEAHQGVEGQVRLARWLGLETSSVSLYATAGLILVVALVAWKATLFGGVYGLCVLATRQARTAGRRRAMAQASSESAPGG